MVVLHLAPGSPADRVAPALAALVGGFPGEVPVVLVAGRIGLLLPSRVDPTPGFDRALNRALAGALLR